jgi:hypothetical protein
MLATAARAQGTQPSDDPATDPAALVDSEQMPDPPDPLRPKSHWVREVFAGTLAVVLQTATGGLIGAVNGRIMDWFSKKTHTPAQEYLAGGDQAAGADLAATAAVQANASQTGSYLPAGQVYDIRTGQTVTGSDNPYATPASGYAGTLYAGIAYEVHALAPDGRSTPINAATYEFHTGDRFIVYFRPSLPGRLKVYNINPAGQQTLIEATNMAAGQMTRLGPYEFTRLTGDEALRLVLSPCSNPQLLAATRDIVLADAGPLATPQMAPQTGGGVQLADCDAPTTRGLEVRTRDIQKVVVDGMTSFALDPVSQQEHASGEVAPREVTIVFHHR